MGLSSLISGKPYLKGLSFLEIEAVLLLTSQMEDNMVDKKR